MTGYDGGKTEYTARMQMLTGPYSSCSFICQVKSAWLQHKRFQIVTPAFRSCADFSAVSLAEVLHTSWVTSAHSMPSWIDNATGRSLNVLRLLNGGGKHELDTTELLTCCEKNTKTRNGMFEGSFWRNAILVSDILNLYGQHRRPNVGNRARWTGGGGDNKY